MLFREATVDDIMQIQHVRRSVNENSLSDLSLITDADYVDYLTNRGKGWVCEVGGIVAGFAVADLKGNNIWALFVLPKYERRGIGLQLHDLMLTWYFNQTHETVWLSTDPGTRAAQFYGKAGWRYCGPYGKGEVRFELPYQDWKHQRG